MTPLDQAYGRMLSGSETDARAFYRLLADAPLFILLDREPEGSRINPKVFDLEDGPVILGFDLQERLASLGPGPSPFVVLPGRIIAQQLTGQGVSLGLNFGSGAASEVMLPPEVLRHLSEMLDITPEPVEAVPTGFLPPDVPEALDDALRFTLQGAAGLAVGALLAKVRYEGGRLGHMLALVDAVDEAREPLARAVAEAMVFAGIEAGELDVTFLSSDDTAIVPLARVARLYEIPLPEVPPPAMAPRAPGHDPDKPPRLR
jgi:hypothetical protein